jgi:crossover junction endodeoxyribonuclease RuvC
VHLIVHSVSGLFPPRDTGAKKNYLLFMPARTLVPGNMPPYRVSIQATIQTTVGAKFRVLGVDPAVAGATGYGIVEFERPGATPKLIRFGSVKLPQRATFAARLREIHQLISKLVEEFAPDAVAVESVFMALNVKTALRLAEMRGVVLLAAAQAQIPAHSYSPREVKASVAGFGGASKQQVQQMVSSILGLSVFPEPADASDALAIALCHAHVSRARARLAEATAVRTPAAKESAAKAQIRARAARA